MFFSHISLGRGKDFRAVEEQPFNIVYTIEFDTNGIPRISSEREIPPESLRFEPIREKEAVEYALPTRVESRIHPLLQAWVESKTPDSVVEVIITLNEDQKIPRLPRLVPRQPLESPANRAILKERNVRIEKLKKQRGKSQTEIVERLQPHGLVVLEQYWLVNSLLVQLPVSSVKIVASQPEVTYIQPREGGEPPPSHDGNPNNDVADARSQIQSDPYFNNLIPSSSIAVLDTGVRKSHVLFKRPRHLGVVRDCVNGGSRCQRKLGQPYNPLDDFWNHGTSTIGIITANSRLGNDFRGVTRNEVDSLKVYDNVGLDSSAAVRGFQTAMLLGDDVIVAEMQAIESEAGAIATTADNAYNAGAIIVAANGNDGPADGTVRSPAIAHKVIGAGAYNIETGLTPDYQGRGPATDGRIKPDVQGPTETETARNQSNTALGAFGGTSGSTPYVGAAAALVRDWIPGFDNGQVYAWLINSGQTSLFNNTEGAGHLKLFLGGAIHIGKVSVSNGETIYIPFSTASGDNRIDAAIWWPESLSQQHNDIDLCIYDPSNNLSAFSQSTPSIFERARVDGSPLTQGEWNLCIDGNSVPAGPQTVYYVINHTPFIP